MPHARPASPPSSPFPSPFCPVSQTPSLWCIYWSDTVPVPVLCSNVWWVFKHRRCFRYCWAVCCFVLKFIFLVTSIPPAGLELRTPRFTLACASSRDSWVPHDLLFYSTTFIGNQSVFSYLSFLANAGGPLPHGKSRELGTFTSSPHLPGTATLGREGSQHHSRSMRERTEHRGVQAFCARSHGRLVEAGFKLKVPDLEARALAISPTCP